MRHLLFICLIITCALLSGVAQAASALSVELRGRTEVLRIALPSANKTRVFTLSNPPRIVVDMPTGIDASGLSMPPDYKGTQIRQLRMGKFDAQTMRLVIELNQPANPLRMDTQTRNGKTLITIELGSNASTQGKLERPPAPGKKEAKETLKEKKDPRPTIIIDAGHGGQDPGTIGPGGVREKDVVLQYARALRRELLGTGKYRVVMTRDDDSFVLLRERVRIARRAKGDMFISLHADSAPERTARGLSVYTLSETASDAESAALAERENKVDVLSGMDLSGESKDVADILISLAQRETNNRSAVLAGRLITDMQGDGVELLPNAHRFAGFAVLKAPDIPSLLMEIGFLSNPQEEKALQSKQRRDRIVRGLIKGIDGYFSVKRAQQQEKAA